MTTALTIFLSISGWVAASILLAEYRAVSEELASAEEEVVDTMNAYLEVKDRAEKAEAESAYDRAMLARVSEWAKHVRRDVAAQREAQTPTIDPAVWTRVLDDVPEGER